MHLSLEELTNMPHGRQGFLHPVCMLGFPVLLEGSVSGATTSLPAPGPDPLRKRRRGLEEKGCCPLGLQCVWGDSMGKHPEAGF